MITLRGAYTDDFAGEYEYVCRVFAIAMDPVKKDLLIGAMKYVDGVGQPVIVKDGDVLIECGHGTWFALYQRKEKA